MYVEFRQMIQINLFPGQEQTCQHTEQTCGHRKKGREDGMNWESSTERYVCLFKDAC